MATPADQTTFSQVAVSGTEARVLAATVEGNAVTIKALAGNAAKVYVGATGVTSSTGWELSPGDQISIDTLNPNQLYVIGSAGSDRVCVGVTG